MRGTCAGRDRAAMPATRGQPVKGNKSQYAEDVVRSDPGWQVACLVPNQLLQGSHFYVPRGRAGGCWVLAGSRPTSVHTEERRPNR